MNILLITTFFQPDSAIAAVRPYQLAKYLAKAGHSVTVLRSGKLFSKPIQGYSQKKEQFCVISFLGSDSDAERYNYGLFKEKPSVVVHENVPAAIRKRFAKVYHILKEPVEADRRIRQARADYSLQRIVLKQMRDSGRQFDLVFSTYSKLENVFAGEYASKLFNAKWIMDFRDPIVQKNGGINYSWNLRTHKVQLHALKSASLITTVSEGLTEEMQKLCPEARVETLYNGYDPDEIKLEEIQTQVETLVICYTGIIYRYRKEALEGFLDFLTGLIQNGKIEKNNLRFVYAGPNSEIVKKLFDEREISEILDDHGYVSRDEAQEIQNTADLFLVLSWNTKTSQGVLTGKFYEGIRAGKPILSVIAGDLPGSELYTINQKYRYGFCYELCQKELQKQFFTNYFISVYNKKIHTGMVEYNPMEELKEAFRYDRLAERLIMLADQIDSKDRVEKS